MLRLFTISTTCVALLLCLWGSYTALFTFIKPNSRQQSHLAASAAHAVTHLRQTYNASQFEAPAPLYSSLGCPSPYTTPQDYKPKNSSFHSFCTRLETVTRDFTIDLCSPNVETTCNSFDIVIQASLCRKTHSGKLSTSPEEDKYARESLGPETFHISVSGIQLFATVTPHTYTSCRYVYHVPLSSAGGL